MQRQEASRGLQRERIVAVVLAVSVVVGVAMTVWGAYVALTGRTGPSPLLWATMAWASCILVVLVAGRQHGRAGQGPMLDSDQEAGA